MSKRAKIGLVVAFAVALGCGVFLGASLWPRHSQADWLAKAVAIERNLDNVTASSLPESEKHKASFGERAKGFQTEVKPAQPADGIRTGYLIFNGHYVPPPYKVELRETEKTCAVLVNGLVLDEWDTQLGPPAVRPKLPRSGVFQDRQDVFSYVAFEFPELREKYGVKEAIKRMSDFLRKQPMVEHFRFTDDGEDVYIKVKGEKYEDSIMLTWMEEMEPPKLPSSGVFDDPFDLFSYAGSELADLREKYGAQEAIRRMSGFLRKQPMVEHFRFAEDGLEVEIKAEGQDEPEIIRLGPNDFHTPGAYREAMLKEAADQKTEIQEALKENRLVMRTRATGLVACDKETTQYMLRSIMAGCQQVQGEVDNLSASIDSRAGCIYDGHELAWELLANLRYRDLSRRVETELGTTDAR